MRKGRRSQLGILLTELRRAFGLTQEALAKITGLSVNGIYNLESGQTSGITYGTLIRLNNVFMLPDRVYREAWEEKVDSQRTTALSAILPPEVAEGIEDLFIEAYSEDSSSNAIGALAGGLIKEYESGSRQADKHAPLVIGLVDVLKAVAGEDENFIPTRSTWTLLDQGWQRMLRAGYHEVEALALFHTVVLDRKKMDVTLTGILHDSGTRSRLERVQFLTARPSLQVAAETELAKIAIARGDSYAFEAAIERGQQWLNSPDFLDTSKELVSFLPEYIQFLFHDTRLRGIAQFEPNLDTIQSIVDQAKVLANRIPVRLGKALTVFPHAQALLRQAESDNPRFILGLFVLADARNFANDNGNRRLQWVSTQILSPDDRRLDRLPDNLSAPCDSPQCLGSTTIWRPVPPYYHRCQGCGRKIRLLPEP